jgi:RHS repeat-associated protein
MVGIVGTEPCIKSINYNAQDNTVIEAWPNAVGVTASYDGYGRLTSYTRTGESNLTHVYNGMDDRVSTTKGTDTRRYVYAMDGRVLAEYGTSATDVKAEYIWMSPEVGEEGSFGGDDGLGGYMPLAVVNGTTLSWVHGNHMGVPVAYTNATGAVIATPTGYSLPGFPGQSMTFADLYYNRYRDYDPTTGRYIQADPIGLAGGPSPYQYALGNPVRYTDPTGEFVPAYIVGGIIIGAGVELIIQAGNNWRNGIDVFNPNCYEWGEVAIAGGMGAFGGNWIKTSVKLTKGSMKWDNVSRRIRRAEKLVGKPIDLHHWLVPQRLYKGKPWADKIFNRPWNLNPVPRDFHQNVLNPMGWPRAVVNGAPGSVQGAGLLGLGGVAGEISDGGWE